MNETSTYTIKLGDQFSSPLSKLEGRMNKFESSFASLSKTAAGFGLAFGASEAISFLTDLGKTIVSLGAEAEMTRVSIATMLGGNDQLAGTLISDIQQLGAKTVFTSKQIATQAQLLLNYGTNVKDVIPYLSMLGDASAGSSDNFIGLTRGFAQVQATGRLMGQDLNQLIQAGFNPLQQISLMTGESMGVLKGKMEDGLIPFSQVRDAFKAATSEGGRFYNLNEKLSKTLTGRFSTLKDNVELLGISLGQKTLPILGRFVDWMAKVVGLIPRMNFEPILHSFRQMGDALSSITAVFSDLFTALGLGTDTLSGFQIAINLVAASLRIATTPLRIIIITIKTAVDAINALVGSFVELGRARENVMSGNFDGALQNFKNIGAIGKNLGKSIADSAVDEFNGWKGLFDGPNEAAAKGSDKSYATDAEGNPIFSDAVGGTSTNKAGAKGKGSNAAGVEKISAGTRNVTLNIQQLIGKIEFSSWNGQNTTKMKDDLTKLLLSAVNDVNIVAQ